MWAWCSWFLGVVLQDGNLWREDGDRIGDDTRLNMLVTLLVDSFGNCVCVYHYSHRWPVNIVEYYGMPGLHTNRCVQHWIMTIYIVQFDCCLSSSCFILSTPGTVCTWHCLHMTLLTSGTVNTWHYQHPALSTPGTVNTQHWQCMKLSVPVTFNIWHCLHPVLSVPNTVNTIALSAHGTVCTRHCQHLAQSAPSIVNIWHYLHPIPATINTGCCQHLVPSASGTVHTQYS